MTKIVFLNPSLIIAVSVQLLCQAYKVIFYSIKSKKLELKRFIHPAGMPSAHTAFVTALTVSIGFHNGLNSELFALSFVFSMIIIYDSIRLRGAVQSHSRLLAKLCSLLPEKEQIHISQFIGHTIPEVIAGALVGFTAASLASQVL